MEATARSEGQLTTQDRLLNLQPCQTLVRHWVGNPQWSSYDVIPALHSTLFTGRRLIPGEGAAPKLSDVCRPVSHDVWPHGGPGNLYPDGRFAYILMSKYTSELDRRLRDPMRTFDGEHLDRIIGDAAWAYYVLARIHPFGDGNGRVGRMALKRVLKGSGVKDPVYHEPRWFGEERSTHLNTMNRVHDTNNLAYLKSYIASNLINVYNSQNGTDGKIRKRLLELIDRNRNHIAINGSQRRLTDIWEWFEGVPMYQGNSEQKFSKPRNTT